MEIRMSRKDALVIISKLPLDVRQAIILVIETAETQGDYHWNGQDSVFTDDANETLQHLADEIKRLDSSVVA